MDEIGEKLDRILFILEVMLFIFSISSIGVLFSMFAIIYKLK